jgi:hypothetical protein
MLGSGTPCEYCGGLSMDVLKDVAWFDDVIVSAGEHLKGARLRAIGR